MYDEIQRTIISEKKIRVEICKLSVIKEFWCSVCTSAEELSTQFTLIVTSQRQKKATPPTEERKYTIVQDARSHLVDQKF